MPGIGQFEEIRAWQIARQLTRCIYALSAQGQFSQDFALRDQIRRAAISVMSNIAEGFESRTRALFLDYLGRAKASLGEVRSQLYIALDCGYIGAEQFQELYELTDKAGRQLYRFMEYLRTEAAAGRVREPDVEYTAEADERIAERSTFND